MYSSNQTSELTRRDRQFCNNTSVATLSTRIPRDDLLVCQVNPVVEGYLPDGDQRPRFLRCFPLNSNVTITNSDLMMIFNPEQGSTVIGARYVWNVDQQRWGWSADISVSASLDNFVESKMVSSAITVFSDTISTTSTVLSGRVSTVCSYDIGSVEPTFENIGQFSIGPKYSRVNQSLADGVVFITPPNAKRASSLTETSLLDGVPLPSILSQQPIATINIPAGSTGNVFQFNSGLYSLRGKPFYLVVKTISGNMEPSLLEFAASTSGAPLVRQIPAEDQLLPIPVNSSNMYFKPLTSESYTLAVYATDALLYNDSHLKTVCIIQGSIGTKNINVSGNVRYELIPKAVNIQQTAFTPIIAFAPHVFEGFQLLLRDYDFFSLVYSRDEYARVLMMLEDVNVSDIVDSSTQGVASFAMLPFIKKGVSALKSVGINPGNLIKKGLSYGGNIMHKGLDKIISYADEGVGRMEKLGYATYGTASGDDFGTATGVSYFNRFGPVIGSLARVTFKDKTLSDVQAVKAICDHDLLTPLGFTYAENVLILYDATMEWKVYVDLNADLEKETFWVLKDDKYTFKFRPNPMSGEYIKYTPVLDDVEFGTASFSIPEEDKNLLTKKRVRLAVDSVNPDAGKTRNKQVDDAAKKGVNNPIPEDLIVRSLQTKANRSTSNLQRKGTNVVTCSPFICVTSETATPVLSFLTVSQVKRGEYYSMFDGMFNVSQVWQTDDLSQIQNLLKEPMLFSFMNGCEEPLYVDFYLGSLKTFGSISWFGALFNAFFGKCPLVIFEATAISIRDQIFWSPVQQILEKSMLVESANDVNLAVYKKFFQHPVVVFAVNMITLNALLEYEANGQLMEYVGANRVVTIDQVMNTGIVTACTFGPVTGHTIKSFTNSQIGAYMATWKAGAPKGDYEPVVEDIIALKEYVEDFNLPDDAKPEDKRMPDFELFQAMIDQNLMDDILASKIDLLQDTQRVLNSDASTDANALRKFRRAKQIISIVLSTNDPEKAKQRAAKRREDAIYKAPAKVEQKIQREKEPEKKQNTAPATKKTNLQRLQELARKAPKKEFVIEFETDEKE